MTHEGEHPFIVFPGFPNENVIAGFRVTGDGAGRGFQGHR